MDSPHPLGYQPPGRRAAAFLFPPPGPDRCTRACWVLAAVVTMAGAILPAVLWPGEISWINDEPRLISNALHANGHHSLAVHGLKGNFGITYGPTATQIYQALLLLTHNPFVLVVLRAGGCAGVTAGAMLWLGRSLRFNPWFAAAVALAPFLWVFHRIMWDASFAIPVGMLGLAAYAAFLRSAAGGPLVVAVGCCLLLPFIHPQDVPLAAPILLHLVFRRYRAVGRHWIGVLVVSAAVVGLNWKYLHQVPDELKDHFTNKPRLVYPGTETESRLEAFTSSFKGGRILGGHGYMDGTFPWQGVGAVILTGKAVSHVVYGLIWVGIVVAGWRVYSARYRRREAEGSPEVAPATGRAAGLVRLSPFDAGHAMSGIALGGLAIQVVIFTLKRVPPDPQYFFGTFALEVLFAWLAIDAFDRVRLGVRFALGDVFTAAYGLSVAAITLLSMWHFYVRFPGKDLLHPPRPFPTLNLQVDVARELNKYTDDVAMTDVDLFQRFPQAVRSLRLLMPPEPGTVQRRSGRLVIRYADGPGGPETRLEVVEAATPADVPADATPMDVTPLPEGWEPKY